MKWNKYDIFIVLCIASIAWGGLEVLHALLPIRIIGLFGLLYFFRSFKWRPYGNYKGWRVIFILWLTYVIMSLAWTPDFKSAILQAIHLVLMFGVLLLFQVSSIKSHHPLSSIILGWSLMVAITVPVAIWELTTGNHLSSGSANEDLTLTVGALRAYSAVTFGNLNSYSVVLCYSLPFLLLSWMVSIPYQKIIRVLSVIVIGIIVMNASRGCVVCVILALLLFVIVNTFHKGSVMTSIGMISFIGFSVWFAIEYLNIDLFFQLMDRLEAMGMEGARDDVYKAAFKIAESSYFMGSGVESTVPMLKSHYSGLNVLVTHSFYLELLVEYGIVFFVLLFGRFYLSTINVLKSKQIELRIIGLSILVTSPILFSVDDYYSAESAVWVYFFSIMVMEALSLDNKKRQLC